jgi:hypothetical protein
MEVTGVRASGQNGITPGQDSKPDCDILAAIIGDFDISQANDAKY